MLKTKEEIEEWLNKMQIKKYTINDDLTVDVDGYVNISRKNLTEIPFQFGKVYGYFDCSVNKLTSLKGCPIYVNGQFWCDMNKLKNLDNCPEHVSGHFFSDIQDFYPQEYKEIIKLKRRKEKLNSLDLR